MSLFQWLIVHGYWVMFLAMLVEGPIISAAGAFAAKLGYFSLSVVFALSILGNLLPDIAYYALGYWGRSALVERFGKRFGLDKVRINRLESLMREHAAKTLLVVKLVPFLAIPGLMAAGLVRMPLKKYILLSVAIIIPTSLLFFGVGYYAGAAYDTVLARIDNASYVVVGAIALFVLISYFWKKITAKLANNIEKI